MERALILQTGRSHSAPVAAHPGVGGPARALLLLVLLALAAPTAFATGMIGHIQLGYEAPGHEGDVWDELLITHINGGKTR